MRTLYVLQKNNFKKVNECTFDKHLKNISNKKRIITIHVDYKSVYLFPFKKLEPVHKTRTTKMVLITKKQWEIITSIPVKKIKK